MPDDVGEGWWYDTLEGAQAGLSEFLAMGAEAYDEGVSDEAGDAGIVASDDPDSWVVEPRFPDGFSGDGTRI